MAGTTDEEHERRASLRARCAAEAAEADDRRVEERRLQWQREGVYITRAEIEAGEACRGCGQPLLDGLGDRGPLNNLTPDQRAACDRAEELYRERHRDCRSHRWSFGGHRALHCGYCCRCRLCLPSRPGGLRRSCPLSARGRRTLTPGT